MIRMLVQASRENKGRSAAEAASSRRASLDKFQAGHGGQPSLSLSRQVSESLSKRQREHASFSLTGRRSGRRAGVQPWRGLAVTRVRGLCQRTYGATTGRLDGTRAR